VKWGCHRPAEDFPPAEHLLLTLHAESSPPPAGMGSEGAGPPVSHQLRSKQQFQPGFPVV